jgi:nucleoside-diphosphate-sugar epimerase
MNLASGEPMELGGVLERIGRLIGRPELLHIGARPARAGEPMILLPDVTLMKRSLQFKPRFDLDSGLKATLAWWREHIKGSS